MIYQQVISDITIEVRPGISSSLSSKISVGVPRKLLSRVL